MRENRMSMRAKFSDPDRSLNRKSQKGEVQGF